MSNPLLPIYIGWDTREQEAYDVLRHSIIDRTQSATYIRPLKHRQLRDQGLFDRPWRIGETGQYVDERDGKPFSTEFSHSRFLTPYLARRDVSATGWALFLDCDFLLQADIKHLFDLTEDRFAVMCVKHHHNPTDTVKMDGVAQTQYHRKNWSSLVLFNLAHPLNADLTPDVVNHKPGSWLHAFGWLPDEAIGEIGPEWNWIEGVTPDSVHPKAVHYSAGGPWFDSYENVRWSNEWKAERARMMNPRPTEWERLSAIA